MTPQELLSAAHTVLARWPEAELVKNGVGNLSILDDGAYVGWINLRDGEVKSW